MLPPARHAALVALTLAGAACQTYDFEPVAPLSVRQTATSQDVQGVINKPNFLLLVDKSGSMDQPTDPSLPTCRVGGPGGPVCGDPAKVNPCNVTTCPTRWSELSLAIGDFLQDEPLIGRYGLALFPEPESSGGCGPTTHTTSDVPASSAGDADGVLQAAADAARTGLLAIRSENPPGPTGTGGGTPTAASLAFLLNYQPLLDPSTREQVVILLTDGLPNCNPALAPLSGTPACQCTFGPSPDDCPADVPPFSGAGCLDVEQGVKAVNALAAKQIQTFVVGFGADTGAASARDTLQRMAVAGSIKHPRVCPGTPPSQACSADNPCDLATGLCSKQYYQATDAASLAAVLQAITATPANICTRPLTEVPDDVSLLSVTLDGTAYLQGADTWLYQAPSGSDGPAVVFQGALCDRIKTSTATTPAKIEIRILKIL
jgi:hypothetical protein